MKIIHAGYIILSDCNGDDILKSIERIGRVCYKSENKISNESAREFVSNLIMRGHESVIEHEKITVKIICDRGISHEIVRHRLASYSQESTRYCNYSQDRFGNEITLIKPCFWDDKSEKYKIWKETMEEVEKAYFKLINEGAKPEEARSILPNSLKTEIIVTMNLREWRHYFKLRTAKSAHPQMREISIALLIDLKKQIPIVFDDIQP